MNSRHLINCLAYIVLGSYFAPHVSAQDRFFRDDFEDGDPHDHEPANWQRGTWNGGALYVEDNDLYVTDCSPGGCAIAPTDFGGSWLQYGDVSLRAQARILEGEVSIVPWGRWGSSGYFGYVNNENIIGVGINDASNIIDTAPFAGDVLTEDVVLKFDIIGDEMSLAAWVAGEPHSDLPQVSFRDSQFRSGIPGFTNSPRADDTASIVFRWLEIGEITPGDVDTNDVIDAHDIDYLSAALREGLDANRYDVNRDKQVNVDDRETLIHDVMNLWIGDSNLDGEFNTNDLTLIFQAGEYEDDVTGNSIWATGDWNGDAEFNSGDLIAAFQDGSFEQGPKPVTMAVPEPSALRYIFAGMFGLISFVRRKRKGN